MTTLAAPRLAKVDPPDGILPPLRLLRTLTANPMATWPKAIYEEPIHRARFLRTDVVFVMDPDLIRQVLLDDADSYLRSEATRRAIGPAVGDALLTADGERWRWQRRVVAPIFRPDRVQGFLPKMISAAERTRDRWLSQPPGAVLDLAEEMTRTTFHVIAESMLSGTGTIENAKIEKAVGEYLESTAWKVALALMGAPTWAPHPGKARAARARDLIRGQLGRVVAERRTAARRDDLVSLLIEATDPETGEAMSDADICSNLFTFIAAGHETTALALTWTFYLLGLYPEVERRVLDEIEAITDGRPPNAVDVERLAYTRQVIQEAMRLYPPAPIIAREARREARIGPELLVPGESVMIPVYAVHRHKLLWARPESFEPDRFLPDAAKVRHRYAYLPFGAGPRVCIGMGFAMVEAVAILATLLPAAELRLASGHMPELKMRVTLRPAGGMRMTVRPR
jgi:cytochrome P450